MLDTPSDSRKIALTCRFIQHDQWLTTHIEPSWNIRQLKLWLIHRLFAIPVPQRIFLPPPSSGKAPERPPSPITFAPDPRNRPASPIIFAPPQKSGFYGSTTGRGWLSDTDDELFSGDDSGASSSATLAKKRSRMMTISVGPGGSHSDTDSSHIPSTQHPRSPTSTTPAPTSPTSTPSANPDVDRFPGGINTSHWTLIRYSTGQLLPDEDLISWNDIHEFELVELHGPSLPSTHILYEYQVCHLWNPERHLQERERLKGKLAKQFQAEITNPSKYFSSSRDKNKDRDKGDGPRTAYHNQVLKAMSLDSSTGTNLGVVEYYGPRLAKAKVMPSLTRIPRSIDVYVQPYWEGWVRTLRIVYRGNPHEVAFLAAMGGGSDGPSSNVGVGGAGGSNARAGQGMQDAYRYGGGHAPNGFGMGPHFGYFNPPEKNPHHPPGSSYPRDFKLVRVEWRERWVKIQSGHLIVLREPNNEEATHVLPLKNIISLMDTRHLVRYLSYSGFNPPLDHPSVTQDILAPAISLPIHRPPRPAHGYFDESSSDESSVNRHHRRGAHSSHGPSTHHGLGHHSTGSWPGGGVGGVIAGAAAGNERGGKEYSFDFRDASHLHQHTKARELTPLVGSRFDPTYLPITIEEQKASGLRVVCLQFRKQTSPSTTTSSTTKSPSTNRVGGSTNNNRKKLRLELEEEREKLKERERAKDNAVEPSALALEDMKERAGEWGGLRSNNPLWKCPTRLRREPIYIYRFKTRMRMRYSRNSVSTSNTATNTSGSRGQGGDSKTRRPSSGKAVNQDFLSVGGGRAHHRHRDRHHHRHQSSRKGRGYHELSERDAVIAAQILGAISPEERERKAEKARIKKEKEKEKERLKHEKELREASLGVKEKEKDWKLGALNVDFWNWGKKKKKAKQEKQRKLMMEEHERQVEEHFAAASAAGYKMAHTTNESSTTIEASMSGTIPSVTAIGSASGARSAGPSSDEDGLEFTHWDRVRSETSNVESTEEDDDDDDEGSEDDDEGKEVKDEGGDEEEDDGVPEPYSDAIRPESPPVRDDDEEEEEIEYADSPDPSISNPGTPSLEDGGESIVTPGPSSVTSVVVQVEVDKRVETETETEDGNRRRSKTVASSQKGKEPQRLSFSEERSQPPVLREEEQHPSHRLIGQLHTSDDERNDIGEGQQGDDDSDLSSPVFAPPPSLRKLPIRSKHNDNARSVSSHRSSTSFDASQEGSTTGDDETDDDLTFDNEFPDFKRSGYRYGLYNNRKGGEKTRFQREMEEQKAREAKIREQRKMEEREVLLEKERRERRKREEEGEWVCLDLGNDFAFGSFLRIVHQHCPHPMKSTFLERMLGQPLNDHPPPSQSSTKSPPTGLHSIVEANDAPMSPTGREAKSSRIASMPMPPSTPSINAPSSHLTYSDDSELEYVTPLPGYGDPRFQYPSRISATVPYPEWRLNILRKAQRSGTGDVGRAMEMLYWGREDPVIAGASGVVNEFERLAKRWEGNRGGVRGFRSYTGGGGRRGNGKGKMRESGSETEDNVSSLGTIGPTTVGSSSTVTGLSPTQQRRMSTSGRSIQSAASPKQAIPKEGGDSGNESSAEDSDAVTSSTGGDSGGRKHRKHKKRISSGTKLVDWSDEEDNTSELEWAGWQMDLQRQAKRQYAIQARREVESTWESDAELADLGLPVNPTDDMKKYIKNRHQLEPEAKIVLGAKPRAADPQTALSSSTQISSTSASLTVSSPLTRVTTLDAPGSLHTRTPSQNSHTLHHSASLHTGLKKDPSSLRRPSMPTLNVSVHQENRVERGKSKDRPFWDITGMGSSNEEPKSPTIAITKHGWFTIGGSSSKDREGMSPGGTSALQAASGSGSAGRSGNILLGRSKLKKKDLGEQEREKGKGNEADREARMGQQRPQLRVSTSHSTGSPASAAVVESIKSPTLGHRHLARMQSDASILSNTDASPPSQTKKRRVMGKLRELADSSMDFAEGM